MNTLTIPSLSLAHRKTSLHQPDNYLRYDHSTHTRNTNTANIVPSSNRDYYPAPTRGLSSNSRYKSIAEDYLQKRTKSPSYYIQSIPYIYNIPSHLPKPASNNFGGCQQCQIPAHSKRQADKNNDFLFRKNSQHQTKLIKDPYLEPTFRSAKGFINNLVPSWIVSNQNVSKAQSRQQQVQSNRQQSMVSKKQPKQDISNSKIMQKLKTHQSDEVQYPTKIGQKHQMHEASIQTINVTNQSINIQTEKTRRDSQRPRVEKILQQQKMLIESLKFEVDRQGDFNYHVQDLQSTKNDYIEKSRQLLFKLNELADDKREFSFVLKSFANPKKSNVFRDLDL